MTAVEELKLGAELGLIVELTPTTDVSTEELTLAAELKLKLGVDIKLLVGFVELSVAIVIVLVGL